MSDYHLGDMDPDARTDQVVGVHDRDGDGRIDAIAIDRDGDIDTVAIDTDGDGQLDMKMRSAE